MYVLDYLIYHLRPYGIVGQSQPLPDKLSFADVIGDADSNLKDSASEKTDEEKP